MTDSDEKGTNREQISVSVHIGVALLLKIGQGLNGVQCCF